MATTTTTSAASVIEEVVSSIVQETLIQQSVLIPSIKDMSAMVRVGMDTLKIPRFTALPVLDVTEGSEVTPAVPTIATDDLLLDKNKAITWTISDKADLQSKVDLAAQIVRDAARKLAAQIDDDIVSQLLLASAAAPDHRVVWNNSPTDTITIADITNARKLLNEQNVPMSDRFMLLPPAQEKEMLELANFIEVDKYGSADPIQNGEIGRVYGFRVLLTTSSNLAVDEALFYHRDAVAYASQLSPKFESDRNILKLEDEFALSQLYGVKVLDSGKRQVLVNDDGL